MAEMTGGCLCGRVRYVAMRAANGTALPEAEPDKPVHICVQPLKVTTQ
jgi:hypothetical protein